MSPRLIPALLLLAGAAPLLAHPNHNAMQRTDVPPEFPAGTYHYVLTEDFPFIPRSFRGTPDASFKGRGGPGGPGGPRRGPPGGGPPPDGRP